MSGERARSAAVRIDRATPRDARTVSRLVREIAAHEGSLEAARVTEQDWARMLEDPRVVVLIARVGGNAAGYVSAVRQLNLWLAGEILALDDLYVSADYRDQRVGRALMTALAQHAGVGDLPVRWEMNEDNEGAQRFYARLGASLRTKVIAWWPPTAYRASMS